MEYIFKKDGHGAVILSFGGNNGGYITKAGPYVQNAAYEYKLTQNAVKYGAGSNFPIRRCDYDAAFIEMFVKNYGQPETWLSKADLLTPGEDTVSVASIKSPQKASPFRKARVSA